ncbi:MAG TPA: lysophospholipid acyltransferase family protein [Gammaproteobacteria bacterium]|nr:lysophospholipid acyltransferase family protein [Gammaproteobacteria bacterium]
MIMSLRILLRVLGLVLHVLLGIVLGILLLPGQLGVARKAQVRVRNGTVRWWLRVVGRLLGVRVFVCGEPVTEPALLVANHISWIDIIALAEIASADFVAKQEVRDWPLFGWLTRVSGTLFVRRGDFGAARILQARMERRLAAGRSLILFPEGTTSDAIAPRPFKSRLFQAAIRTNVLVQPVAISYPGSGAERQRAAFVGDQSLLENLWPLLGQRSLSLTIRCMPPISASGAQSRALARDAWVSVCEGIDAPVASVVQAA